MRTTYIFDNPLANDDLDVIGKADFTIYRRILISSLHPRQTELDENTLAIKVSGKNHTQAYVVCTPFKNILIDGHHTVAAKKIKGRLYVMALCCDYSPIN